MTKFTDIDAEWAKLLKAEAKYLRCNTEKSDSRLNKFLAEKVPDKLQSTLDAAFFKAFQTIFEKGTPIIEKTYNGRDIARTATVGRGIAQVKPSKKLIRAFSDKAEAVRTKNTLLSGASGIGMGVFGIGLPDIPLFTAMILRSAYEVSLGYGYDYNDETERRFILMIIEGGASCGERLHRTDDVLNAFIESGSFGETAELERQIKSTAGALSSELLYMKFLQGIPLAGAVGGAYDAIYMNRITKYANIKYRRRLLADLSLKKKP